MASASPVSGNQNLVKSLQPKTSGRGLNKPKCSKCGNVARSRCPYQCCKSCCSKAQNPCTIHVLRPNANFSDKVPASSSPLFGQSLTDAPSLSSSRFASVRHSNLSSLDRAHVPFGARKPLTRKEAAVINAWRFTKLKEHNEQNIEVENEAFDRYMQNVSLLEEAFGVNSFLEGLTTDGEPMLPTSSPDGIGWTRMISGLKARLRSTPERAERQRERIQGIVSDALEDLRKRETDGKNLDHVDPIATEGVDKPENLNTKIRSQYEKLSATNDLLEKMAKVRSKEDLKICVEMKSQLFPEKNMPVAAAHGTQTMVCSHEVCEDALKKVDEAFLPVTDIVEL